jgi:hypothetical protein
MNKTVSVTFIGPSPSSTIVLQTHSISVDVFDSDKGQVVPMEVPVLLATDIAHEMWKKDSPKLWSATIGATAQKTHVFWDAFRRDPACTWNHPVLQPSGSSEIFSFPSMEYRGYLFATIYLQWGEDSAKEKIPLLPSSEVQPRCGDVSSAQLWSSGVKNDIYIYIYIHIYS